MTFPCNLTKRQENLLRRQNKRFFHFRDYSYLELSKNEMMSIIKLNIQLPFERPTERLDQLADLLAFGAIMPCLKCNGTQWLYSRKGYICRDATSGKPCNRICRKPLRMHPKVPYLLRQKYEFLDVSFKVEDRFIPKLPQKVSLSKK